jgi:hypothetical protein
MKKLTSAEQAELDALLATFTHKLGSDGEITAPDAEGVWVSLGNYTWAARSLLSYLRTHPKPSDW